MENINWGIIGCGDVTEIKSGPAFNKVPNSRLVAVMRRNADKARDYAERHGVPKWYNNAQQLISDPEINAVYVATPPLNHEEYTIAALQAGKPVYVEKPMALDTMAAQRMLAASRRTNVKLSVAHYRRQQPMFIKIKELIESKAIGDIRLVNLQLLQPHQSKMITQTSDNWRINPAISGGGLFHDLAPHQLDLMIYFFGMVDKAKGLSLNQGKYYFADDLVGGQMIFRNKVFFNGIWSFTVPPEEATDHCDIIGTEGKISFSVFENRGIVVTKSGHKEEFSFERLQHLQQPMIEKVVRYFLDEEHNPCSAEEGVEVMRLIDEFTSFNK